ncbi:MAG TPA: D-alanyl-D-alanine carboxypeptidase [candidate division Zixibacteria bacterium]|nr:D-alanyl-D-alanine carboxypeptidase [candidate division Zixibacteria bacterium]
MQAVKGRRLRTIIYSVFGLAVLLILFHKFEYAEIETMPLPLFKTSEISRLDFDLPDSNICRDIYLNLRAAIVIDNGSEQLLYSYNADKMRSIASISKLLTAMVVLDEYMPDSVITITREDARRSRRSIFRTGDKVKMRDLLHSALLQSDNRAARALARTVSGSIERFAERMNELAEELGLDHTIMYEPSGMDDRNQSTAADCARLVYYAMQYPEIARITSLKKYEFKLINRNGRKKRLINTNKMVFSKYKVLAGKTGYIIESDYCLATIIENGAGDQITLVVLGSPGPQTRFREARRLANYSFRKIKRLAQGN